MNDCRSGGLLLEEKGGKAYAALTFPLVKAEYVPFPQINSVAFGVTVFCP